jgi:hypothetical protein
MIKKRVLLTIAVMTLLPFVTQAAYKSGFVTKGFTTWTGHPRQRIGRAINPIKMILVIWSLKPGRISVGRDVEFFDWENFYMAAHDKARK